MRSKMQSNNIEIPLNVEKTKSNKNDSENKKYRLMAGAYIIGISGITAAIAGVVTSRVAKKRGREYLKELGKEPKVIMENPHSLALRALAWGTFWAVGVCSLTVFGVWKWFGIKDLEDLRTRVRKYTRKPNQSEGRTEFENLTDLINYLNETSKKKTETKDT